RHTQDVGSFPINMVLSPDGQFAITSDIGSRQAIWAIRLSDAVGTGHVLFPNKRSQDGTGHSATPINASKRRASDGGKGDEAAESAESISNLHPLKKYGLY